MKAEIQRKLKAAQVFCFDVDSTVVTVEGIDELAALAGVADAVKKLTTAAMEGGMDGVAKASNMERHSASGTTLSHSP